MPSRLAVWRMFWMASPPPTLPTRAFFTLGLPAMAFPTLGFFTLGFFTLAGEDASPLAGDVAARATGDVAVGAEAPVGTALAAERPGTRR